MKVYSEPAGPSRVQFDVGGGGGRGTDETGVTAFEAADAGLLPTLFFASTTNVYFVPLVKPVTVALLAEAAAFTEMLPGDEVTV